MKVFWDQQSVQMGKRERHRNNGSAVGSMQGGVRTGPRSTRSPLDSAGPTKASQRTALGLDLKGWGLARQLRGRHRHAKWHAAPRGHGENIGCEWDKGGM